jgi:hypothetical protein
MSGLVVSTKAFPDLAKAGVEKWETTRATRVKLITSPTMRLDFFHPPEFILGVTPLR